MRRLLNSFAQELQGSFAPQQPGGGRGYGGSGGYGGGGIGGLINSLVQQVQPPSNVPCPRKVPQAGFPDWFGMTDPRYQFFNVCPSCYHSQIRPTPFAGAFAPKPPAPPHLALRCDMSRFWVGKAGLVLMTMNQDRRHDISLLPRVVGINVHDGLCPNTLLDGEHVPPPRVSRVWYTIRDPNTGVTPLPGWTICSHCVVNMQTLCPTISNVWVPISQGPVEGSCAFVPSDRFDDQYTAQQLQYAATCVVTSAQAGRTDMSALVNWLRDNPPPPRGAPPSALGGGSTGRPWQAPSGPCPQNYASSTLKCYTMRGLFEFTVCEKCYAEVIKTDLDRGVELARHFDTPPSVIPSGFTCQLYSARMRQVWAQAAQTGNLEFLAQKVRERRSKQMELEMKTAQLQQQAKQLREQARVQEHLAANAMRAEVNRASNASMVNAVGGGHRIDAYTVEYQNSSADFTPTNQMNNQAAMLNVQAAQLQDQARLAEDEWKRYWE